MSGVRIRRAREVDVTAITRVVADAFAPFTARTGIVPMPVRIDWPTTISAGGARVAVRDEQVIGVLVVWPHPGHLLLETVAVAPAVRGTGVGAMLIAHAELEARHGGLPAVRLDTNALMTENLTYYPRRGYVEIGRGTVHGFDRVHFEKRLGAG